MKRLVYLSVLLLAACAQPSVPVTDNAESQSNAEKILHNRSLAASNLNYYEFEGSADTKAPRGYKPFYISHYGRHGSRYMDSGSEIGHVRPVLEMADSCGILTDTGKDFHKDLMAIIKEQEGGAFTVYCNKLSPEAEKLCQDFPIAVVDEKQEKEPGSGSAPEQERESVAFRVQGPYRSRYRYGTDSYVGNDGGERIGCIDDLKTADRQRGRGQWRRWISGGQQARRRNHTKQVR